MYEPSVPAQPVLLPEENKVTGTVGAFLFALAGGLVYYLLYQIGYLAAISGIVGVSCALVGYRLFAKRESRYGTVIAVVMAALVILLAWYLCLAKDVYAVYKEWYQTGEIDYAIDFFTAVRYAYRFLEEPDIARSYLTDLIIGLLLCVVGWVGAFAKSSKQAKAQAAAAQQPMVQAAPSQTTAYVPPTPYAQSAQTVTAPAEAATVLNGEEAD